MQFTTKRLKEEQSPYEILRKKLDSGQPFLREELLDSLARYTPRFQALCAARNTIDNAYQLLVMLPAFLAEEWGQNRVRRIVQTVIGRAKQHPELRPLVSHLIDFYKLNDQLGRARESSCKHWLSCFARVAKPVFFLLSIAAVFRGADAVVIPILPSPFDASANCQGYGVTQLPFGYRDQANQGALLGVGFMRDVEAYFPRDLIQRVNDTLRAFPPALMNQYTVLPGPLSINSTFVISMRLGCVSPLHCLAIVCSEVIRYQSGYYPYGEETTMASPGGIVQALESDGTLNAIRFLEDGFAGLYPLPSFFSGIGVTFGIFLFLWVVKQCCSRRGASRDNDTDSEITTIPDESRRSYQSI